MPKLLIEPLRKKQLHKYLGCSILTVWANNFSIKACCHTLGRVCKFVQRCKKIIRLAPDLFHALAKQTSFKIIRLACASSFFLAKSISSKSSHPKKVLYILWMWWIYLAVIAQWLAWWLATKEVPGSNPGKGENLLISD